MPMYDVRCPQGHADEMFAHGADRLESCRTCGSPVERLLMPARTSAHSDDVPGGFWIENMAAEPLFFRSKSEHRRKMKELGLVPHVRHVGTQGGDKSRHTSRWV